MKKKLTSLGIAVGCFLGAAIIAYAISTLFFTKSSPIPVPRTTIFQFDLSTGANPGETGPGDSFAVSPTVYNDATENMYVFIVVEQPYINDDSLYTYSVANSWKLLSSTTEKQVYAYAGDEMTIVSPGETTDALTDKMTMKSISNAEYSILESLDVTITGYAIGTDEVATDPEGAWAYCRNLGNIE